MRQVKSENQDYNNDFYKWGYTQADLLKSGQFEKIDLANIIEEIEDLSKSRRRSLKSQIVRLLMHMLKIEYQSSKHSKSWDKSIGNARVEIEDIILENPSLKRELKDVLKESYAQARKKASIETGIELKTFPEKCPWTLKQVLGD